MQRQLDFDVLPWREIRVVHKDVIYMCHHGPQVQVSVGDFTLMHLDPEGLGRHFVGKVLRINVDESLLQVQMYIFPNNIENNQAHIPELNAAAYSFVSGMTEVLESNRVRWIGTAQIIDYAYVFHIDSIHSGQYICHGMENAYYVRLRMFERRLRNNPSQLFSPEITLIDHKEFLPFSHLTPTSNILTDSSHHRSYQVLILMKRIIDQIMWTERKYKQGNGVARSQPIPVSREGWNYIKFCFLRRGIPTIDRVSKRAYKAYFNDLTSSILSLPTTLSSIEALTPEEMSTVRSIFGSAVGFGCRRPKPRKKDGMCRLQVHEQVNVIEFTFNPDIDLTEDHEESAPIQNSLVLLYDATQLTLRVRVCHSYVRVMSLRGQAILEEINHSLASTHSSSTIMIGSTFSKDGNFFETTQVESNGMVSCKNMITNEQVIMCANEVQTLIEASN